MLQQHLAPAGRQDVFGGGVRAHGKGIDAALLPCLARIERLVPGRLVDVLQVVEVSRAELALEGDGIARPAIQVPRCRDAVSEVERNVVGTDAVSFPAPLGEARIHERKTHGRVFCWLAGGRERCPSLLGRAYVW